MDDTLRAFVVESHTREKNTRDPDSLKPKASSKELEEIKKPETLSIRTWYSAFNGTYLSRVRQTFDIEPFDGEKPITSLPCFPKEYLLRDPTVDSERPIDEVLVERGKTYVGLMERKFVEYHGETINQPRKAKRKVRDVS